MLRKYAGTLRAARFLRTTTLLVGFGALLLLAGGPITEAPAAKRTGSTRGKDQTPPSAPVNLKAGGGDARVDLSWSASTDNVSVAGYHVYRNGTQVATTSKSTLTYSDAPLPNGVTDTYVVRAYDNARNVSSASNQVSATPVASSDTTAPSAPTGLTAAGGDGSAGLSWTAASDNVGVTGYMVFRDGAQVGSVDGSTTAYTDAGLSNGTTYSYTVKAKDAAGNLSAASNAATATTKSPSAGNCTGTELFCDDFDGLPGSPANTGSWTPRGDNVCDNAGGWKNSNIFHDGAGGLTMRIKRESTNLCGIPFSGAFMGTFSYGSGWPATGVKRTFAVPFHVEARVKDPATPGAWGGLWLLNTDRSQSQGIWELDVGENRSTFATQAHFAQHLWVNGADSGSPFGCARTVTDVTRNYHVYSADIRSTGVSYYVDGVQCGSTQGGVSGHFGVLFDMRVPTSGSSSWGAGGGWPGASDPGPWDMTVDYVKVTA
jgi:chitodextrinase